MNQSLHREVAAAQELPAKDTKHHIILEVEQEKTVEAHPDLYNKGHTNLMKMIYDNNKFFGLLQFHSGYGKFYLNNPKGL